MPGLVEDSLLSVQWWAPLAANFGEAGIQHQWFATCVSFFVFVVDVDVDVEDEDDDDDADDADAGAGGGGDGSGGDCMWDYVRDDPTHHVHLPGGGGLLTYASLNCREPR